MNAVILAAGLGRRLAPLSDKTQKALLPVGGRPVLARMLIALAECGIRETVIVVGHCADQVRALGSRLGRMAIRYIHNPEYARGSVLSLYAARTYLSEPVLVMDADVIFPREFLRRLLVGPAPSALLIDRSFKDTGEEVKLYTRGARVIALGKKYVPEAWETLGEGVGFFRCGAAAGPELVHAMEHVIATGDGLDEYEDALNIVMQRTHVTAVDVTGLPWTEIDYAEDLRLAESEILPRVRRVDADG